MSEPVDAPRPTVLFLCTGNYYRSRFAECLFRHLSKSYGLDWCADSRGLFEVPWEGNVGFMSPYALAELEAMGVDPGPRDRFPEPLRPIELELATRVVAMDESEHRPLLDARFRGWSERVDFWHVHDIDQWSPRKALPVISTLVEQWVGALAELNAGEAGRITR